MSIQLGFVFLSTTAAAAADCSSEVTTLVWTGCVGVSSGWAVKYREQINLLTPCQQQYRSIKGGKEKDRQADRQAGRCKDRTFALYM